MHPQRSLHMPALGEEFRSAREARGLTLSDVIGTALGRGSAPDRLETGRPVALVFGNEETGLDPATIAACDKIWSIPGSGRVQSLNVAAAAAILLYVLTRP